MTSLTRIKGFVRDHRRLWPTAALLAGFVWDAVTLGRPDQLFDNVVLLFYLMLAGAGILLVNYHQERSKGAVPLWQLLLIQFSFGNLAGALLILFGKSGTLVGNWPFLFLFALLIFGNEFLHGKFQRLRFHIAIYYVMVFSYAILVVPIVTRSLGTNVFLMSGAASILALVGYLSLLGLVAPVRLYRNKRAIVAAIALVFVTVNGLYFLNFIPPVPLSLKEIGIYHDVTPLPGGGYQVTYEKGAWYEWWKRSDKIFHYQSGTSVFCFSSVFAPARIATTVSHRWEFFSESANAWQTATRVSFPIEGGRDEGFRGFSEKETLTRGKWRCSVETERGVLIGRRSFEAVRDIPGEFATDIR